MILKQEETNDNPNLDFSSLEKIFTERSVRKGEFFIRQGDMSGELAIVKKGLFRSYYIDNNGNDITKYFYPEESVLFSYAAYCSGTCTEYSVEALEDSVILAADANEFNKTVNCSVRLKEYYRKEIDKIIIAKEEHALSFKLLNGTERYQAFCNKNPGLENRIKQYNLATFLGMTPITLSRIRKKLKINK